MAKYPYLPLWTDAYLADTRHLSTLEHGAYLLLLFEAWRRPRCTLPNNDELLARLAGLSADEWAKVRTVVMAFWKIDKRSKEWTQIRLTRERMYVDRKSGVQRDRIVKYWKEKKKTDTVEEPWKYQVDTGKIPPTPTPTPTVKEDHKATPYGVSERTEPPDLKEILFGPALAYLVKHSGQKERSVRGLIGRWIKDYGEAPALMAISAAQRNGAVEAVAYTNGALKKGQAVTKGNDWIADWYTGGWNAKDDNGDGSKEPSGKDRRLLL